MKENAADWLAQLEQKADELCQVAALLVAAGERMVAAQKNLQRQKELRRHPVQAIATVLH